MSGQIRPAPGGDAIGPARNEIAPGGGGIFRRLSPKSGTRSALAGVFAIAEGVFTPAQHAAAEERERQRRLSKQSPSATDPPDDDVDAAPAPEVAAPGRPGTPFSGFITVQRPVDGSPS